MYMISEIAIFIWLSFSNSFISLISIFLIFFTEFGLFTPSMMLLVPQCKITLAGFLRNSGLIWSIITTLVAPKLALTFTEWTSYIIAPVVFLITESPTISFRSSDFSFSSILPGTLLVSLICGLRLFSVVFVFLIHLQSLVFECLCIVVLKLSNLRS